MFSLFIFLLLDLSICYLICTELRSPFLHFVVVRRSFVAYTTWDMQPAFWDCCSTPSHFSHADTSALQDCSRIICWRRILFSVVFPNPFSLAPTCSVIVTERREPPWPSDHPWSAQGKGSRNRSLICYRWLLVNPNLAFKDTVFFIFEFSCLCNSVDNC
jgi:hypothetical protein